MFIVRCIVGTLAVITIIGTIYYIITNKLNPPVRHIVELGEFGVGDLNDCGPFKVPAGKTLEVTFEIQTRSGQAAEFDLKRSDVNGAKITTGGVFTWPVPSDTKPGRYSFTVHYKDPGTKNSSGYSALYVDVTE